MDTIRKNLNIYFKCIEPWEIIEYYYERNMLGYLFNENINLKRYIKVADNEMFIRSKDEICNIYKYNQKEMMETDISPETDEDEVEFSIFNLLSRFGEIVLNEMDGEPVVEYKHLLRWNDTSKSMGQDIFTCAFLARKDSKTSRNRYDFSWRPIIKSNNNRLENILSKGIAENHFHLYGSSNTYFLSWISLMNRVEKRKSEFKKADMIDGILNRDLDLRMDRNKTDLHDLVIKAALIRLFFFKLLNDEFDFSKGDDKNEKKVRTRWFLKKLKQILYKDDLEMNQDYIQKEIQRVKYGNSYKVDFEYDIDYAIPVNIPESSKMHNIYMFGERGFLYRMFKEIYNKNENVLRFGDLFYAYLVIKEKFRSEMIQVNKKSGFENFSDYQSRKSVFLKNEKHLREAILRISLDSTLENQNIKSLEARIKPESTCYGLEKQIRLIDEMFDSKIERENKWLKDFIEKNSKKTKSENNTEKDDDRYFYNLHFIKRKDKNIYIFENKKDNQKWIQDLRERDCERREVLKKEAHAIAKLRSLKTRASGRIYGIDACSNEIGCRPEVFAQAFRFLRTYAAKRDSEMINLKKNIPVLGATYHAGEDFIDIIDGLRAIDEVVKFIKFGYGDRIGHALALGIDVRDWADYKERTIVINKQDYLDNIVWLMCKMRKFNVNDRNLEYWLEKEFYRTFDEIYMQGVNHAGEMESELRGINTTEYYWSWKLRGDNPKLYKSGGYKDIITLSYWDSCSKNVNRGKDGETFRKNKKVSYLYHLYHYNSTVKSNGTKMKEYKISEDMINAVIRVQKGMMNYVKDKGIAIETNPSSNVLIGTFKKYNKHPLINFYNLDLTMDQDELRECPQMFVSINTDDQGVFDTYLENEYALMALALEKEKNNDGTSKYNQAMIYRWLDNIRQMGLEQSFRKIK